jgi:hypothetical protein
MSKLRVFRSRALLGPTATGRRQKKKNAKKKKNEQKKNE